MFDLRKLIDNQDINQLLLLIEFILCIVLKCQNSADLCSRFLDLEASAMEDIKRLIDSSQIEVSEYQGSEFGESFINNNGVPSFAPGMVDKLEVEEGKRRKLEIQMIEMEEEAAE